MEESIVERVLILMKEFELTASEFADKIDVQRSSMSHLVSGRNKPSLDFIQKILNNFSDINPTWLIMGTGPMKQLHLFDIEGDVAPIVPIPTKNRDAGDARMASSKEFQDARMASTKEFQNPINKAFNENNEYLSEPTRTVYPDKYPSQHHSIASSSPIQAAASTEPTFILQQTASKDTVADSEDVGTYGATNQTESHTEPITQPKRSPIETPVMEQSQNDSPTLKRLTTTPDVESNISEKSSQNDKKVVKIVFFYSDNTFETFNPQ